jgi:hypothetical protein
VQKVCKTAIAKIILAPSSIGVKFIRRMLAGDSKIKRIVTLGDFGEIKDWV